MSQVTDFEFECAHELLMNLNLNPTFAKSMNLNLNLEIKNKMNGSSPSRK